MAIIAWTRCLAVSLCNKTFVPCCWLNPWPPCRANPSTGSTCSYPSCSKKPKMILNAYFLLLQTYKHRTTLWRRPFSGPSQTDLSTNPMNQRSPQSTPSSHLSGSITMQERQRHLPFHQLGFLYPIWCRNGVADLPPSKQLQNIHQDSVNWRSPSPKSASISSFLQFITEA